MGVIRACVACAIGLHVNWNEHRDYLSALCTRAGPLREAGYPPFHIMQGRFSKVRKFQRKVQLALSRTSSLGHPKLTSGKVNMAGPLDVQGKCK